VEGARQLDREPVAGKTDVCLLEAEAAGVKAQLLAEGIFPERLDVFVDPDELLVFDFWGGLALGIRCIGGQQPQDNRHAHADGRPARLN
jgi:hypothetical protein